MLPTYARLIEIPATRCVYVGDADRDIRAGRAAGMTTTPQRLNVVRFSSEPVDNGVSRGTTISRWTSPDVGQSG